MTNNEDSFKMRTHPVLQNPRKTLWRTPQTTKSWSTLKIALTSKSLKNQELARISLSSLAAEFQKLCPVTKMSRSTIYSIMIINSRMRPSIMIAKWMKSHLITIMIKLNHLMLFKNLCSHLKSKFKLLSSRLRKHL